MNGFSWRSCKRGSSLTLHATLDAQMDMAEVKHSEWCRNEIALAQADLAAATRDGTQPDLRNKWWGSMMCLDPDFLFHSRPPCDDAYNFHWTLTRLSHPLAAFRLILSDRENVKSSRRRRVGQLLATELSLFDFHLWQE